MMMHPTKMFSTKRFKKKCMACIPVLYSKCLIIFSNIVLSEKFMNNFLLTIWHKKVLRIGRTNNLLWKFWKGEGIDLGNGFFVTLTRGILAADLVKKKAMMGWWGGKDQTLSNLVSFFHFYRQDKGWCLAWGLTSRYYFGLCWLCSEVSTRDTSCSPRSKFLETPGKSTSASFASKAPSATRDRLLI